jgi:two-component system, chemotaxis family, chemotaxis protein CheY
MIILSIDDSKAVHAYLNECFKNTDVTLRHAFGPMEGVKEATSAKEIDLILLDWEMPEMSGPEVYDQIRAAGCDIPTIMLTSKNSVEDITQMLGKGVKEYVMKPFTAEILIEKIETVKGVVIKRHGA